MAAQIHKAGSVAPEIERWHHAYRELSVWVPLATLLALTVIAGFILFSKVSGY